MNLLEWMTSEEAEKQSKSNITAYIKQMWFNIFIGTIEVACGIWANSIYRIVLGVIWIIAPEVMWYISQKVNKIKPIEKLNSEEKNI